MLFFSSFYLKVHAYLDESADSAIAWNPFGVGPQGMADHVDLSTGRAYGKSGPFCHRWRTVFGVRLPFHSVMILMSFYDECPQL